MTKRKSNKQIDRLNAAFTKFIKTEGLTRDKIEKIKNYREYNKVTGAHKTNNRSMNGDKRLLKQVWDNRKQVLLYHEKKNNITDNNYKNFLRKQMVNKFKTHRGGGGEGKRKKPKKPKRPKWVDIKINGSVHGRQVSFTIKSYTELKRFIDEMEGSNANYSRSHGCVFVSAEQKGNSNELGLNDLTNIYNIYYNFDYGSRISI